MLQKKFIQKLLIGTILATTLVGCNNVEDQNIDTTNTENNEVQTSNTEEQVEVTTIRLSSFVAQGSNFGDAYLERIAEFEARYPNIVVDHYFDDTLEYYVDVLADFETGNEPHIIFTLTEGLVDQISPEMFMTVEDIRKDYPFFATNIHNSIISLASIGRELDQVIPITGYYKGLYYNEEMFDIFGLEYPTTWDNLITAVNAISQTDITPIAISYDTSLVYWLEHLLLAAGGDDIYKQSMTAERLMWVEAVNKFQELYTLNAFSENMSEMTITDAIESFYLEQSAMIIEGSWLKNNSLPSWAVQTQIPYLTGINHQYIIGFDAGFFVTTSGFNSQSFAVTEFINFMTSIETLDIFSTATRGVNPTRLNVENGIEGIVTPMLGKDEKDWQAILSDFVIWMETPPVEEETVYLEEEVNTPE
ncbi:MAG: hypothetical protein ATN35_07830 [Epulopiscium sp. Nele67-Bin004]|nr:MAG: hypothetical protein ATN35_07830 [Epulopiscium sp. Nele67-Bin004]